MFDDDDGAATVDQAVQLSNQLFDIGGMQTGRRFIENVERAYALRPLQLGRQLDPLGFASGQFSCRLSQPDVTQSDFPDDAEAALQADIVSKKVECFIHGHAKNIGYRLAGDLDLERLVVVTRSLAARARRVDAWQEE